MNTGEIKRDYNSGCKSDELERSNEIRKHPVSGKFKNIDPSVIGANIRRLRTLHRETQRELGELLGYGATTIANYESGYRMPDLETFIHIAMHYGASIEEFLQS